MTLEKCGNLFIKRSKRSSFPRFEIRIEVNISPPAKYLGAIIAEGGHRGQSRKIEMRIVRNVFHHSGYAVVLSIFYPDIFAQRILVSKELCRQAFRQYDAAGFP